MITAIVIGVLAGVVLLQLVWIHSLTHRVETLERDQFYRSDAEADIGPEALAAYLKPHEKQKVDDYARSRIAMKVWAERTGNA